MKLKIENVYIKSIKQNKKKSIKCTTSYWKGNVINIPLFWLANQWQKKKRNRCEVLIPGIKGEGTSLQTERC